jgi:glycerate 2-kinase
MGDLTKQDMDIMERIIDVVFEAADPVKAVESHLHFDQHLLEIAGKTYNLDRYKHIYLIGFGKAVIPMTEGLVHVLGNRITKGVIITKHIPMGVISELPEQITVLSGDHPIPGVNSIISTRQLISTIDHCSVDDLVICLISGGGSALLTMPVDGITLEIIQRITEKLLMGGADIHEINTVRKCLDRVKGGGLAEMASPAQLISLILSDVVGNPVDIIASGPTVTGGTDNALEVERILHKYAIDDNLIMRIACNKSHPLISLVQNEIVSSNYQAACKAVLEASQQGFNSLMLTTYLQGDASVTGKILAGILKQMALTGDPVRRPGCVVLGGETTVVLGQLNSYSDEGVSGDRKPLGGRNLEVALGAVRELDGLKRVALVTLATDGEDGPTDAAGAIVTGDSWIQGKKINMDSLDFLNQHDSYNYFKPLNALIKTGPTGTNVNDLTFLFTF